MQRVQWIHTDAAGAGALRDPSQRAQILEIADPPVALRTKPVELRRQHPDTPRLHRRRQVAFETLHRWGFGIRRRLQFASVARVEAHRREQRSLRFIRDGGLATPIVDE